MSAVGGEAGRSDASRARAGDVPLRIAMVATPWYTLPPQGYGGIEAMCAELVDALVTRGHDVTVLGCGPNGTKGSFVDTYDEPQDGRVGSTIPEVLHAARVARALERLDVDVVHDHSTAGPLQAAGRAAPTVVTAHGPADGEIGDYYRALGRTVSVVAISDAQRQAAGINWVACVHNAVDVADFPLTEHKDDYVLFLGRASWDKGAHVAIDVARAAGRRILLAGKCEEPSEHEYFRHEVRPRLGEDARWLGEADFRTKVQLLSGAQCLLFPILWDEPFGMVMVEAMACGTPVVGLRRGSVPEVVVDGVTGFVRDRADELPAALAALPRLSPADCRAHVREHFDVEVMTNGYEEVYRGVLAPSAVTPSVVAPSAVTPSPAE